jgi:peptidoglycan/LPS O-acetylase OafA/YrhL
LDRPSARVKPAEIKALSGARAIGAVMIVLYHFCNAHYYVPFAQVFGPPVMKGYLWVEFFFALSGFILVHVYAGRRLNYGAFLKARLARLYPIHLATLLSLLALMLVVNALAARYGFPSIYIGPHAPTNTAGSFVASLFLVQSWGFIHDLTWNTASWFVSVEFFLCLIFPLFLVVARGGMARGLVLIAGGATWLVLLGWNSGVGLDITFNNGLFRGMADFSIGAGLALIFAQLKDRAIPERIHSLIQAGVLVVVIAATYFSGPRHSRGDIMLGLALIALILPLAFDKGFLARLFQTRPFQILGGWSYAIYMGQTFWMQMVRQIDPMLTGFSHTSVFGIRFSAISWYAEPVIVLAICILWGALMTALVERPAYRLIRRLEASNGTGR